MKTVKKKPFLYKPQQVRQAKGSTVFYLPGTWTAVSKTIWGYGVFIRSVFRPMLHKEEEKKRKQILRRTDQGAVRKFITKRKTERKPWFVEFT